eukprot:Transcript_16073.p1 GENE.Transcript_16073~~Transcript_16073.p1  ORF type:complete len:386 (-),score=182.50 Transcript_16073:238-1353(-)
MLLRRTSALTRGGAALRRCAPLTRLYSSPIPNDAQQRPAISISFGQPPPESLPDPFVVAANQLRPLDASLKEITGSDHPVLTRVAQHFFELVGKRFRPTIVLLASSAASGGEPASARQVRLAEITEMIHAASLLHDDVIDLADTRRGVKAAHRIYGNKVAVLAGDFLLARASVLLARLQDVKVVELLATVIEEMVQGEMMQVKARPEELLEFDHYLSKTYRKTAALMALSCEAAALLGDRPPEVQQALQAYGRHLGIAYQLVDDYLDFTGSAASLGKPAFADMEQGLATAPALFAFEEHPQIGEIIKRRFGDEGDAALVGDLVSRSEGLRRTQELATAHARQAAEALGILAPSTARDALLRLCFDVLNRQA